MDKRILILNGSPRKNGNTSRLVKEFERGAVAAGNTSTEFFLESLEINGCKGCFGGHSSRACPCVQNDSMSEIYPVAKASDVVVFASPLYYWNVSGQLKKTIDRLFALEEGDGQELRGHGRSGILIMAAEGNGFEDVTLYFDHLMEHLQWGNLGHVLAGGVNDIGDIEGKSELKQAYELGKSI